MEYNKVMLIIKKMYVNFNITSTLLQHFFNTTFRNHWNLMRVISEKVLKQDLDRVSRDDWEDRAHHFS
jgi:hypothetical protein